MTVNGPDPPTAFVERTALAWRRTGLTLFALALGGAKVAQVTKTWVAVSLAGATALMALAVVVRAEQLLISRSEPTSSRAVLMTSVVVAGVLLAATGAFMALA